MTASIDKLQYLREVILSLHVLGFWNVVALDLDYGYSNVCY